MQRAVRENQAVVGEENGKMCSTTLCSSARTWPTPPLLPCLEPQCKTESLMVEMEFLKKLYAENWETYK